VFKLSEKYVLLGFSLTFSQKWPKSKYWSISNSLGCYEFWRTNTWVAHIRSCHSTRGPSRCMRTAHTPGSSNTLGNVGKTNGMKQQYTGQAKHSNQAL